MHEKMIKLEDLRIMSMEIKPDKNKKNEANEQLIALEKEVKMAFKSGQFESVVAGVKSIRTLDPGNRFADSLARKVEVLKKKEEEKAKAKKVRDYKIVLKKLFKDRDLAKLKELAAEFGRFDPENRIARLWIKKAEKLEVKLTSKKEVRKEKIEIKKPPLFNKPEPVQPKPATLASTLAVKTEAPKPVQTIPKEIQKPLSVGPVNTEPEKEKKPALFGGLVKKPEAEEVKPVSKGNIFTKMFGKKEEEPQEKSIIDTIVASEAKREVKEASEKKEAEPAGSSKPKDVSGFLTFAKIFMNFTIIFIVLSAGFLYVEWVDKNNSELGLIGVKENTGGKLYHAAEEVKTLKQKEEDLDKEIELYKGGYDDKVFKTVQDIIGQRINWPDIFAKISEVTNSVYELNDFFKYIEYNNYSFDALTRTIRVTGTLSDPLGRNLTKLVELEEAFMYYPKDKNNPDDPVKPYFTGFKEFTSYSKSLDENTGRYTSSFQLSFALN